METIGLDFNDMVVLQASAIGEARNSIEQEPELSFAQYINKGYSEDEAKFRSEIAAQVASFTSAILTVIDANNKRILSDLKQSGLLNR